jgi:hypothetical protein
MNPSNKLQKIFSIIALVLLIITAAVSIERMIQQGFSPAGGNDLYTYWYAGHFLREGRDFYRSFLEHEAISVPVQYLDRKVDSLDDILFAGLEPAPASTTPVYFLLLPLAFLSWPVAKVTWLFMNLALLAAAPLLLVRLFQKRNWLNRWEVLALTLVAFGLTSARSAVASGQITVLILDLVLAAVLLADRKPWLAGLLLGLALSKYSLSLGILILFMFIEPKLRLVLAAVLVQVAAIVALMLISGSRFVEIVREYIRMAVYHSGQDGIHLAAALHLENYLLWVAIGLTLIVGIPMAIWRWRRSNKRWNESLTPLSRIHLMVIFILWALLVGYHRSYDAMVVIIFFGLIAYLDRRPESWDLPGKVQTGLKVFTIVALGLLMVPSGSLVRLLLPLSIKMIWGSATNLTATTLILIFLFVSIFLLFKIKDGVHEPQFLSPHPGVNS